MNRFESKYFNTASFMNEALLELLNTKEYEYISVKEICNKAGVSRSTFYLHYESIDDLLNETITHINERLISYYDINSKEFIEKIKTCPISELDFITPSYIEPYLQCILDNKNAFKASINLPKLMKSNHRFNELCKHVFFPILDRFNVSKDLQIYMMKFYLSGISGIISEWIENNFNLSIQDITKVILNCIKRER